MKNDVQVFSPRFERFCREVIAPAVCPDAEPLSASVWSTEEPVPYADAIAQPHKPVEPGFAFGPAWSTWWFRVEGLVPERFAGESLVVRFSTGTEALAYRDSQPWLGLDVNRDRLPFSDRARAGAAIDVRIEAACNHPFGISTFDWDHAEHHRRWRSGTPGMLDRCELAVLVPAVERLHRAYEFARLLLAELDPASPRAQDLFAALTRATDAINDRDVAGSADRALAPLLTALASPASGSTPVCHAVGHAHIDTAWLWPLRETRRKTVRSWCNTLAVMDHDPAFHFLCSQAQQYAWLEADAPAVFERIRQRVSEGRWEPIGGMWIEPDAHNPSGESLIRQCLHGCRYWTDRFGERGRQRVLYLPDTFGFPAHLPTVMRHCGLDTFITNKMSWNQTNTIPMNDFRWRGLDGGTVLAHLTPGGDYNATLTPKELRRGVSNTRGRDIAGTPGEAHYLQPFGFGDGGGGPAEWMTENARLAEDCDGLPRTRMSSVDEFVRRLHALDAMSRDGLPEWRGELSLELHRGILTTQAWLKQANRRAEQSLRVAEIACFAGPKPLTTAEADRCRRELDEAWKLLLLNQFHDILPGSSIAWVYRDAREQMARVHAIAERWADHGLEHWRESAAMLGPAVFNPTSARRSAVVALNGSLTFIAALPALGLAPLQSAEPAQPVRAEGRRLSNGLVEVELDAAGRVSRLVCLATGRDAAARGPLNTLSIVEDRPMNWDAWDIELYNESKPVSSNETPADRVELTRAESLRGEITVERPLGEASRLVQTIRLDAGSPAVELHTRIDWRERRRLLRAEFEPDIESPRFTTDSSLGVVDRPTGRNTSWERAQFEVPCHRFLDLSEPGLGLAILNDSKYGCGCHGSAMHLTLLRSTIHPDPDADQGVHEFVYALMPHAGDWRAAGVGAEAEALNAPLRVLAGSTAARAAAKDDAPFELIAAGPGRVEVLACKPAEEDHRTLVLRLAETHGVPTRVTIRWRRPVAAVTRVNGLEESTGEPIAHAGDTTSLELGRFAVASLSAVLSAPGA